MAQDAMRRRLRRTGSVAGAALLLAVTATLSAPGVARSAQGSVQRAGQGAGQSEEEILRGRYVETVEVSLILLQATVLDRRGEIVRGLGPEDFALTEEGEPREISLFGTSENQPLKIAFLLDVSGSMAVGEKLERSKEAIRGFVRNLHPRDEVALLIFADGNVIVKKGFTLDRWAIFNALDPLEAWGQTALRDALAHAPQILDGASPGRKALVLITDGVDNASEMTALDAVQAARRVPVPIFAIGLSDGRGGGEGDIRPEEGGRSFFEVIEEFGRQTGGVMMTVLSEADMSAAVSVVESRLRGQYLIGFRPAAEHAGGGFRRVELTIPERRLKVVTREGYYPGGSGGN